MIVKTTDTGTTVTYAKDAAGNSATVTRLAVAAGGYLQGITIETKLDHIPGAGDYLHLYLQRVKNSGDSIVYEADGVTPQWTDKDWTIGSSPQGVNNAFSFIPAP